MIIAICDDMQSDRECLKKALQQFAKENNNEFKILEYSNKEDLYQGYLSGTSFYVIFFDVYIGSDLGTEASRHMRDLGYKESIIFCTSSKDHALDGFKVHADGYLVKPYNYSDFKESIEKLKDKFQSEQKRISFTSDRINYDIPISKVYLIETEKKGCNVYTEKETFFTWKNLKDFSDEIDATFFYSIGKYSLVNLDTIESIEEDYILLKNGVKVFPPKRDYTKIKQDIKDYIWESMRR